MAAPGREGGTAVIQSRSKWNYIGKGLTSNMRTSEGNYVHMGAAFTLFISSAA